MTIGQGTTTETLSADSVQELLARALESMALDGKRVLVIIPDGTAPIPLLSRVLYEQIGRRVARLDYLIALGTHQPMSDDAIDRLVGVTAVERARRYPNVAIFNPERRRDTDGTAGDAQDDQGLWRGAPVGGWERLTGCASPLVSERR